MVTKSLLASRRRLSRSRSNAILDLKFSGTQDLKFSLLLFQKVLSSTSPSSKVLEACIVQVVLQLCYSLGVSPPKKVIGRGRTKVGGAAGELIHQSYRTSSNKVPTTCSLIVRTFSSTGKPYSFEYLVRLIAHEVCHHADFYLLKLWETPHTDGFYSRVDCLTREMIRLSYSRQPARKAA